MNTGPQGTHTPLDEDMRRRIKAYPGTLTFHDLIRKNKRDSTLLMVAMIFLCVALGAVIGGAFGGYTGDGIRFLMPSIILGAGAALVVGIIAVIWSWSSGANAILRMSRAREIRKEDDPELFNVVDELRIAAGLPMPKVYLINDSAMNAFATGRDPEHGVVAITIGLRNKLNRDELQGVLAHEMAHIRHLDIRFSMLMATLVGLVVFTCDALLRSLWYSGGMRRSSGRRGEGGGAGGAILLVVAILLAIIAPLFARMIQMAYSRQREYLADAGAVELTRNPEGLASALAKLASDTEPLVDTANRGTAHMFIVNPLRKMRASKQTLSSPFASHPPVRDRIARLLALTR